MHTAESTLTSKAAPLTSEDAPKESLAARRRRSRARSERSLGPVYEYRYFKDERGRSVQLRRRVEDGFSGILDADWEPIPSASSSYTTFDNSRLTYARSAGLPSLGRKYAPGRR
jgi:hypothetical protein